MKYSKQREAVLCAVQQNNVHPTADYIYNIVKKEIPDISLATVYRNLNVLANEGIIQKIDIPNGKDRFDGTIYNHYHMFCRCCNEVFDCPVNITNGIEKKITSLTGFIDEYHSLIIYGVCNECSKKG